VLVEPGPVSTAFGDTAVGTIDAAPDEREDAYAGFRRALAVRYAQAYDGSRMRLASSPDAVAAVIVRAVRVRRPRTRYTVGPVAKTMIGLRRFAPSPVFDAVIRSSFPAPNEERSPTGRPDGLRSAVSRVFCLKNTAGVRAQTRVVARYMRAPVRDVNCTGLARTSL
jgi:hypothetical protein